MDTHDILAILCTFSKTEYQHGGEAYRTMLMFLSRNDWQVIKKKISEDKVVSTVLAYHTAILSRKECEKNFEDFMDLSFTNNHMEYLFRMNEQERLREAVIQARLPEQHALLGLYHAVFGSGPPSLRDIYGHNGRNPLSLQELHDKFNQYNPMKN